jgi:hypothetical protein
MLQTRNDTKVPKHIFMPVFSSVYAAVLVITTVFYTIELIESINMEFLKVFVLRPTI